MRILSLTVRNYRIHGETTVDFDPARNLIGGDNESGKSTLAEAMHRVLFLRAKTGGKIQKSMVSSLHPGAPEVALRFEENGEIWTVEKRFSGTSGTASLSSSRGAALKDEEAEKKLAELLRNADGSARKEKDLESCWAHLWVWQGTSGNDGATLAVDQKDQLIKRLQRDGLAAVMQSDLDQSVRERIGAAHAEIFTSQGRVKANSALDEAEKALEKAREKLADAKAKSSELDQAVNAQRNAVIALENAEKALPEAKRNLEIAQTGLASAKQLESRLENEKANLKAAIAEHADLVRNDKKINDLLVAMTAAAEKLSPLEAKLSILEDQEQAAAKAAAAAEAKLEELTSKTRSARLAHDFSLAAVTHFEKVEVFQECSRKAEEISGIAAALDEDRKALSALPEISPEDLVDLRGLEAWIREQEVALAAIASGIELLASDVPVSLDGRTLDVATQRTITSPAELLIGAGTRIRIHPGGGSSLTAARETEAGTRQKLRETLDRLTVSSLEEATRIQSNRQLLEQKIATTSARLQALGAEQIVSRLAAAEAARDASAAEMKRRYQALEAGAGLAPPEDLAAAEKLVRLTGENLEEIGSKERECLAEREESRKVHQKASAAKTSHRSSIESSLQTHTELKIQAETLSQSYGDAAKRTAAIHLAEEKVTRLDAITTGTREALAELDPEALERDRARFERSLQVNADKISEARETIAACRAKLTLDGSHDPEADILRAQAHMERTEITYLSEKRRADSIALLEKLFSESQATIRTQITQPIAERVSGYLEALHGRGTRAELVFGDKEHELTLTRPGEPSFSFENLSGGAKEQLAAALRLAMAEILAADHDGSLPILFDDAFAFTDPTRVQALQRMLDLAATRGLQIIVLSCSPADYAALAAKECHLSPQARPTR
ncbi:AAA family ATPase [Luteolibacter algae]|uniref:AAA family ATPase n=1 Tax=Luteolibacter algae TaxID=454151 RepID=A0ABW5D3Y9_9BACT